MNAPHPHTVVRHTLVPPQASTVQAASAWRTTVRPRRRRRPARLRDLAALAICVALLGLFVWTLPPQPEPTRITARAVAR
jgi:ferric-dicitrate binding protein FerR (iron transport regulator)